MIDAALLARIPAGRMVSIEREFFPALIADGIAAFGWVSDTYWRDIGHPAAYRAAQVDLLDGRVHTALRPAGNEDHGTWMGAGGSRAPDARVEAPCVIGAGVTLAAGAVVGPHSVVGDGVTIGAGARLEGAILWADVTVGPGAILRGCVVAAGATIGARAEVRAGAAVAAGARIPEGGVLD
jgi:mannose-1-phosphate guanylyltransferase